MRRLYPALLLAFSAATPAAAAFGADTGVAGAQFLKIGAGARALGMGEAMTCSAAGPEAVYWNPAGVAAARSFEASYTRAVLPAQVSHDYAAVALPLPLVGGVGGFAFTRLSQAQIDRLDNVGVSRGAFAPHSEAFSFAYARGFTEEDERTKDRGYFRDTWNLPGAVHPFDDDREPWTGSFRAGLAAKIVSETIDRRKATTAAFDGGVTFRPASRPALALGWAARNAGGRMKFIRDSEALPFEGALAIAHDWEPEGSRVLTALEAVVPAHARPYAKAGVEWEKTVSKGVSAIGRAGFQGRSVPDLGILSGLTAGAGVRFTGFSFDLAFQPMGALGEAFRLSLSWRFARRGD